MSNRMTRRAIRRLRPRTLGQALVETALVAPFLVMLLLGGAQVGSIAYDQVSLDTAAREGARAGAAAPNHTVINYVTNSRWYSAGNPATYSYQCQGADFAAPPAESNPICRAVIDSAGYLTQSAFTTNPCGTNQACVTITVVPPANLTSARAGPPALRLVSAPQVIASAANGSCVGQTEEFDGSVDFSQVSGFTTATVTDTDAAKDGTKNVSVGSPSFTPYCIATNANVSSVTVTAQAGPVACGGYTGSYTLSSLSAHSTVTHNITLTAEPACTTATTSTTSSTTTTTSSSSTTTATSTTSAATGPATGCADHPVDDSYYFTVTVTYPAPIFIPFINNLFQTSSGIRMITSSITYPIDPCTMTGNGTE